ncbi:glycine cleavage system aminomethyltransferase GcvT [Yanghanlia caeni]|uniref:Aminomethyltransferase n=1 Tax=Yanghanlia caeni TaxID=3064283 RepID=A0ABU1D2B0_9BURK|nr:glycine cleavage system aminomethyltransferase GcvT [Alcaligenaceae bacterium LG-2]NGR07814.1 glycine cleavage system aminomethyltransferase GcvT [bacterium SGD-2]HZH57311.1 glycine cleavage system aminomethyltransferase GcvT [Burkholderiaceae bacterium]
MTAALKHTPLYNAHVAAGARMVDFGGWNMPVAYGSQIEEHHAVRRAAGMFDVSHMLNIDIEGPDAKAFLRTLLANDVERLTEAGKAIYSCMLNERGGVIDDLIVYYFSANSWRLVVNAGTAQTDIEWIQGVASRLGSDITINPRRDLAMLAVQGPEARERLWQVRPQWRAATEALKPFSAAVLEGDVMVARTGYTGEDGFEVVVPAGEVEPLWNDLVQAGVRPCGLGARDTLRLEAGMNLYGHEMNEDVDPLIAGLGWTVSFKDPQRQFIGREAIEGVTPQQVMVGLRLRERGVMRDPMKVRTARGEGVITSGTMSPTMGVSIAMARVPAGVQPGEQVEVEIRGKWLAADVVAMPFVRQGKVLV